VTQHLARPVKETPQIFLSPEKKLCPGFFTGQEKKPGTPISTARDFLMAEKKLCPGFFLGCN